MDYQFRLQGGNPILPEHEVSSIVRSATKNDAVEPFILTSIGDLYSRNVNPPPYIVEDLLYEAQLSIVSARPKVGKSTFARYICSQIVKGNSVLGRVSKKSSVVYFALEEHEWQVSNDFKTMGVTDADDVKILTEKPDNKNLIPRLKWLVDQQKPGLIIIDTLIQFQNFEDINSYTEVTQSIKLLLDIARNSNTHIMVIHHANKGMAGDTSILGSTAIAGAMDTIINIWKNDAGQRMISSSQRCGIAIDNSELRFDPGSRCFSIEEPVLFDDLCGLKNQILEAVTTAPGLTQNQIFAAVAAKTERKKAALKTLVNNGQVNRAGQGTKAEPYRLYINKEVS